MIHYHGTPITPREQLLRMAGRNFCVSYVRPDDLAACLKIGQSVMLDNGAFSAFTKGIKPDWAEFYKWLVPVLVHPHFAVIPDVIDGTDEQQDELIEQWPESWYALGAPVWHLAESIDRLLDLVGQGWQKVCLGSSGEYWEVGGSKWCGRMDETFNAVVRHFGSVPWLHGLRMLGQHSGDWPLASADSTNVAQNFKRDTGCAECKAAPIDAKQPKQHWIEREIQQEIF